MKKLRKFEIEEQYLEIKDSLKYPSVSYTKDSKKVWVMEKPQSYFIGTFETTKENENILFFHSDDNIIKEIYLDDVLVVDRYKYSWKDDMAEDGNYIKVPTIGTHTVKCIMVDNYTDLQFLFHDCKYKTLDLSNLDTSNVTNMYSMFQYCGVENLDVSYFDVSKVTNMKYMFYDCYNLTSITFGDKWDTSNVTDMQDMFNWCSGLTSLDLSSFNTSNVTNMYGMFMDCSGLTSIEFGYNSDVSKVTSYDNMFDDVPSTCELKLCSNTQTSWDTLLSNLDEKPLNIIFRECTE